MFPLQLLQKPRQPKQAIGPGPMAAFGVEAPRFARVDERGSPRLREFARMFRRRPGVGAAGDQHARPRQAISWRRRPRVREEHTKRGILRRGDEEGAAHVEAPEARRCVRNRERADGMGDEDDRTASARRGVRDRGDPRFVIFFVGIEFEGARRRELGRPARLPMIGRGAAQIRRKEEIEFAGAHAADLTDARAGRNLLRLSHGAGWAPIIRRTSGASTGWQAATTSIPPKTPTIRSMAGRMSDDGAAP